MGMINSLMNLLFGSGRNVVTQTAEVFRVNSEAQDQRQFEQRAAALAQMAGEFRVQDRSSFDRLMDGLNRLPRPAMALGTLGLFVAAMVDPIWFAARMSSLALVPEPLWWLLGVVVSFYFGARHQAKGQAFQRDMAAHLAAVPQVVDSLKRLDQAKLPETQDNPALSDWRKQS